MEFVYSLASGWSNLGHWCVRCEWRIGRFSIYICNSKQPSGKSVLTVFRIDIYLTVVISNIDISKYFFTFELLLLFQITGIAKKIFWVQKTYRDISSLRSNLTLIYRELRHCNRRGHLTNFFETKHVKTRSNQQVVRIIGLQYCFYNRGNYVAQRCESHQPSGTSCSKLKKNQILYCNIFQIYFG